MGPEIATLVGTVITVVFWVLFALFMVVISLLTTLLPIGIMVFIFRAIAKQQAERQRLMQEGTKARAKVLSVRETGVRINDQPQVSITLQVRPPDGGAYETTVTQTISMFEVHRVQPGSEVVVYIDPAVPQKVMIHLSEVVAPEKECAYCHRFMPAEATDCPSCGAAV